MKFRPLLVVLHRYAGLTMTALLIIVGLTGSILVFNRELDVLINPAFSVSSIEKPRLTLPALLDIAERLAPNARFESVNLNDDAIEVWLAPKINPLDDKPYELDFDQLLLNPYTGEELGNL